MKKELSPSQRLRHEYKILLDEWRLTVFARDRYTCQDCKTIGGPLEAHHIRSWSKNVNLRFDPNNGVTLCLLCHGKRHGHPNGFIRQKRSVVDLGEARRRRSETQAILDEASITEESNPKALVVNPVWHRELKILAKLEGKPLYVIVDEILCLGLKKYQVGKYEASS